MTENVIGPISKGKFHTMTMLKRSLKWMKEKNDDGRFDLGIQREKDLLKEYMNKALTQEAA